MRAVAIATAMLALCYSLLGGLRYAGHRSGADLGIFLQSLNSPGFANTLEGASHFTYHFSPDLLVLAPLVHLTQSPLVLIAAQAIAGALVAPAIFVFARRRLAAPLPRLLAFSALLYPALAGVTFTDFHENGLAPAAIAWLIAAADARRWTFAALFLAIALGIKEDEAPILAACGAMTAIAYARRGDRTGVRFALGGAGVAVLTFVAYFVWLRSVGSSGGWSPAHFYTWSSGEPGASGFDPLGRISYLLEAFVPLVFVCVTTPFALFALPGLTENLLSHLSITYTMGQHYAGVWIGWLLAAQVAGVAGIAARDPRRALLLVRTSLVLEAVILTFASPTHWGHFIHLPTAEDRALDAIAHRIPVDAPVGSFDEMYAHLAFDPRAQIGLSGTPRFVIDDARYDGAAWRIRWRPKLFAETARGRYRAVAHDGPVTLYERQD